MSQISSVNATASEDLFIEVYITALAPVAGVSLGRPCRPQGYSIPEGLPELGATPYSDGDVVAGISFDDYPISSIGFLQIAGITPVIPANRCQTALVTATDIGKPLFNVAAGEYDLTRAASTDPYCGVITYIDVATGDFQFVIDFDKPPVGGGGGGTMDDFVITDGVTPQTISNADTITFAAGTFIEQTTSAVDTVTGDLSATGVPSATNFLRGDNSWAVPAGGGTIPSGTVEGTYLKWDNVGSVWVETTSATGQILSTNDNSITIDDGATSAANIVLSANLGSLDPSIVMTGAGAGTPILTIGPLGGTNGYQFHASPGTVAISTSTKMAIGTGNGGTLQFDSGTPAGLIQSGSTNATVGANVGLVTRGKDFLYNNDLPAFYQETAQNAEGRWATWVGGDAITISPTTGAVGDAVQIDLGGAAPDQQTLSASWPFYRFDIYYVNVTDSTNEHMTISILHDGLTTNEMEYGWIGTTAAKEMEYVVTVGAELELGLWSNTVGKSVAFYIRGVAGGGMA